MSVFILIFNIYCLREAFVIKCLVAPANKRKEVSFTSFLTSSSKNPGPVSFPTDAARVRFQSIIKRDFMMTTVW